MVSEGGQNNLSKGNYIRKKSRGTEERWSKIEIKYIQWIRQEAVAYCINMRVYVVPYYTKKEHVVCDCKVQQRDKYKYLSNFL